MDFIVFIDIDMNIVCIIRFVVKVMYLLYRFIGNVVIVMRGLVLIWNNRGVLLFELEFNFWVL